MRLWHRIGMIVTTNALGLLVLGGPTLSFADSYYLSLS
jgi:hypothetical protein